MYVTGTTQEIIDKHLTSFLQSDVYIFHPIHQLSIAILKQGKPLLNVCQNILELTKNIFIAKFERKM